MAKLLVARRGDPLRIEGVSDPTDRDLELYQNGALLPGPHATFAGPTFEEWLDSTSPPDGRVGSLSGTRRRGD